MFKVNEYTIRGSNLVVFFPFSMGLTLKGKYLLFKSKFFPLRVDPLWGGAIAKWLKWLGYGAEGCLKV